ncbi:MAG: hypothetical protein WDA22_11785 [Bacteroidota bacterium]
MNIEEKEYTIYDNGDRLVFTKNASKEVLYIVLGAVLILAFTLYQNKEVVETVAYVILEILVVIAFIVVRPIMIEIDSTGLKFQHRLFPGILFARRLDKSELVLVKSTPYSTVIFNDKSYASQVRVLTNENKNYTVFSISQESMVTAQAESDKLAMAIANKLGIPMQPFSRNFAP